MSNSLNFLGNTISYYEIASLFFSAIALYISYKNYRRLSAGIRIFIEEGRREDNFIFLKSKDISEFTCIFLRVYNQSAKPVTLVQIYVFYEYGSGYLYSEYKKADEEIRDYKLSYESFENSRLFLDKKSCTPTVPKDIICAKSNSITLPLTIEPYGYKEGYIWLNIAFDTPTKNYQLSVCTGDFKTYKLLIKPYICKDISIIDNDQAG